MARVSLCVSGCVVALLIGCGEATERTQASGGSSGVGGKTSLAGAAGTFGRVEAGGSGGSPFEPSGGAPSSGGAAGTAGADSCAPYHSCPCGCCPGSATSTPTDCEYPEYAPPADDGTGARSSGNDCSQGCSAARLYACCVSAPNDNVSGPEYSASYSPDFGGRIDVEKKGATGDCTHFELVPGTNTLPSLSSAWLRWNGQGRYGACGESASVLSVIGIEGIIETLPIEAGCILSVHVTVFVGAPEVQVIAIPVHTELSQPVLPAELCPGI